MKKLNKSIDMFCYRHPRFGVPNLMLYIVIVSLAVWVFTLMDSTHTLLSFFVFSPERILKGEVWRLVTFIFVPQSTGFWALLFFYFYYWIGNVLEREWGTPRFNIFIISGVLLTIIYGFIIYFITKQDFGVSTEYLYLSMFFSFATYYPEQRVLFMYIIPIKIKWLAVANAAYFVYEIFALPFPLSLLPIVATLNYLLFCGDILLSSVHFRRPGQIRKTVNFKRETQRIRREQQSAPYRYKCAVCGRTDTDHPELEFRYCSRCAGYHCFCQDHINNHIHFTE